MLRWLPCACSLALASVPAMAGACSDLALVLAVDSSGSVDADEFALQTRGFAAAFRDPAVHHALAAAGVVDVAAVFWADPGATAEIVPWHRVATPGDADAFAAVIEGAGRGIAGDTGIGDGLLAALRLLRQHGCTARAVINLSGDGRASNGPSRNGDRVLARARAAAADAGVTINALAIADAEPGLADYYRDSVITGPDAFVMEVADFSGFGAAIVRKLAREIRPALLASLRLAAAATDAPFPQRPLGLNRPDRSPQDAR